MKRESGNLHKCQEHNTFRKQRKFHIKGNLVNLKLIQFISLKRRKFTDLEVGIIIWVSNLTVFVEPQCINLKMRLNINFSNLLLKKWGVSLIFKFKTPSSLLAYSKKKLQTCQTCKQPNTGVVVFIHIEKTQHNKVIRASQFVKQIPKKFFKMGPYAILINIFGRKV